MKQLAELIHSRSDRAVAIRLQAKYLRSTAQCLIMLTRTQFSQTLAAALPNADKEGITSRMDQAVKSARV
jgi:hypothetical protein